MNMLRRKMSTCVIFLIMTKHWNGAPRKRVDNTKQASFRVAVAILASLTVTVISGAELEYCKALPDLSHVALSKYVSHAGSYLAKITLLGMNQSR